MVRRKPVTFYQYDIVVVVDHIYLALDDVIEDDPLGQIAMRAEPDDEILVGLKFCNNLVRRLIPP